MTAMQTTMAPAARAGRDWRAQAACVGTAPERFFPVAEAGPVLDAQVTAAKAICARCPVRAECLTEALARIPHGIAGGLTEDERRALRHRGRRDRTPAAAPTNPAAGAGPRDHNSDSAGGGDAGAGAVASTGSRSTVKPPLTAGRAGTRTRRVVENADFTAFGRRVLRAAGRRVAAGDVDALPALAALATELDAAITDAVAGLRTAGYSWGEIAARLGVTRQAAHQRWAPVPTVPTDAGSAASSAERGAA